MNRKLVASALETRRSWVFKRMARREAPRRGQEWHLFCWRRAAVRDGGGCQVSETRTTLCHTRSRMALGEKESRRGLGGEWAQPPAGATVSPVASCFCFQRPAPPPCVSRLNRANKSNGPLIVPSAQLSQLFHSSNCSTQFCTRLNVHNQFRQMSVSFCLCTSGGRALSRDWVATDIAVHQGCDVDNVFFSSKSYCSFVLPDQMPCCTFHWSESRIHEVHSFSGPFASRFSARSNLSWA